MEGLGISWGSFLLGAVAGGVLFGFLGALLGILSALLRNQNDSNLGQLLTPLKTGECLSLGVHLNRYEEGSDGDDGDEPDEVPQTPAPSWRSN